MQKHDELNMVSQDCDCCQLPSDDDREKYDCIDRRTVFTAREEKVLSRIREVSAEAKSIRQRIEQLSAGRGEPVRERLESLEQLDSLRLVRAELEQERIAAAEERMRLLGHA